MKVVLFTVGSRGDAEPFCSLARSLAASNHKVDMFVQPELRSLAPPTATIHELPFTQFDFYRFVGNPMHGADHPNPRVGFIGAVTDVIAELVFPCREALLDVAKDADIIVCSSLARPLSFAVADKVGIRTAVVHLQPLMPTKCFPHYSHVDGIVQAITNISNDDDEASSVLSVANEETYLELEKFQHDFLEERMKVNVYDKLEIEPLSFKDLCNRLKGGSKNTLIVNSFSEEVVPTTTDAGEFTVNVGPLADSLIPGDWEPPKELVDFLADCKEPPICVGYGSMPFSGVKAIMEALEEIGSDAVLVGDAFRNFRDVMPGSGDECPRVFQVSGAPYAWLLPMCCMMLSHGGAGVVNATLRAGIPAVISPLLGDQMFWAKLLESKGLGVTCGSNLSTLTKEDLVDGMSRAKSCTEASAVAGRRIQAKEKTGAQLLCESLERT